jgi:Domain of unknown function (DUF1918)
MDTAGFEPLKPPTRPGDRLVVASRSLGAPASQAEIIEVLGHGGPPFRVRWDDGRESIVYPSSDVTIEHVRRRRSKR